MAKLTKKQYSSIIDGVCKCITENSDYLEYYEHLNINIENIINKMKISKFQKEKLYKKIVENNGYNKNDYYINWGDEDNINGIIFKQPLEYIEITVNLN